MLAATIKARWVCEQAHQQLKEELGLDHFEGRSWTGLHRHALMAMIAYAFLQSRTNALGSDPMQCPAFDYFISTGEQAWRNAEAKGARRC